MKEKDYTILQPIHLGTGDLGRIRKRALERIARRQGFTWNGEPSIGKWLISLADKEIGSIMKRDDLVTVTSQEYKLDNNVYWLTIKTDKTGDREFRKMGISFADYHEGQRLPSDWEREFAVGQAVRMGDLCSTPIIEWDLLANISSGVNVHVGEISDGLLDLCPFLVFYRLVDNQQSLPVPDKYRAVAYEAAISGSEKAARKILEESGLFQDVYQFRIGGPSLNDQGVIEVL